MSLRTRSSAVIALASLVGLALAVPVAGCARANATPAASPTSAPPAAFRLRSGEQLRLADARGKVVVLAFFATWCDACAVAIPALDATARDVADDDVIFVAVDEGEARDEVDRFARRHRLELPIALDDGTIAKAFDVPAIPTTVVVARDGSVRHVHAGFHGDRELDVLAREIGALRGEPAPAAIEPVHAVPIPDALAAAPKPEPAAVPCETSRADDDESDPAR